MVEPAKSRTASETHRLTILYMGALGSIALLTIAGQIFVQRAILQLEGDSRIVNIAGRQRMLSQRLTRLTLELAHSKQREEADASLPMELSKAIQTDLATWTQNHNGLQFGSDPLRLPGANSPLVEKLFNELDPNFRALREIIETKVSRFSLDEEGLDADDRIRMSFHSDAFLEGMDAIVLMLEREARSRVSRLSWIETALLVATISVLVCEGFFVFSPALASLNRLLIKLQTTSEELEKARDIAEKANLAKTDFLARVSHELRTPLHAILGVLGLVAQTKLRADQQKNIRLANESSLSLLSLVDDLLDVASIEQGREFVVHPQVVDLPGLIRSTTEMMRPLAISKGLQFELNLHPSLPSTATIDADRVRQVLSNVLQNAIRYTVAGTVRCEASIQTDGIQTFLRIAIDDTGIGIAPLDQERIFASFSRGSQTKTATEFGRGMGLGLAITQSIVKKLGGAISLKSEVGKGSCFTVTLPFDFSKANQEVSELPVKPRFQTNNTAMGSMPTALIVDDSPTNLHIMRSYMQQLRFRTMSVSSLRESLAKFRRHRFDIVLMDRNLADGDGLNFPLLVARTGKTNPTESTRFFLVTAEIHLMAERDPRFIPFARVLHKPISLSQLSAAIEATVFNNKSVSRFDQLKNKLAKTVISALPNDVNSLRGMLSKNDYAGLKFISHRMIGSAGNAGLTDLASLSRDLNEAAEQRDKSKIEQTLSQLTNVVTSFS